MKHATPITTLLAAIACSWSTPISGYQVLTDPIALYTRCYSQLTQQFPSADATYRDVAAGNIGPIAACHKLLDQAVFRPGQQLTGRQGKLVLNHFFHLYTSWQRVKVLESRSPSTTEILHQLYDEGIFGLYFAWATFSNQGDLKQILVGKKNLRAIRPETAALKGTPFDGQGEAISTGPLESIVFESSKMLKFEQKKKLLHGSYGGGLLGHPGYYHMTNQEFGYKSDGAVTMPRNWSRSVFEDLFCRQLPLIPESATKKWVRSASKIAFRKTKSCVVCHASMDQLAGTVRHLTTERISRKSSKLRTPTFFTTHYDRKLLPPEKKWPAAADKGYYRRPPSGRLVMHDISGKLVDVPVEDLNALGKKIGSMDDFYMCYAKRMYHYFLGIDVPVTHGNISGALKKHQEHVSQLARDLKKHRKPLKTIKGILDLPHYRHSDFSIRD